MQRSVCQIQHSQHGATFGSTDAGRQSLKARPCVLFRLQMLGVAVPLLQQLVDEGLAQTVMLLQPMRL